MTTHDEMLFGAACGGGKSSFLRAFIEAHPESILVRPDPDKPFTPYTFVDHDWVKARFEAAKPKAAKSDSLDSDQASR